MIVRNLARIWADSAHVRRENRSDRGRARAPLLRLVPCAYGSREQGVPIPSRKFNADVAGLEAIDRKTLAAVRKLQAEEARLHKRLLADTITAEEHFVVEPAQEANTLGGASRTPDDRDGAGQGPPQRPRR